MQRATPSVFVLYIADICLEICDAIQKPYVLLYPVCFLWMGGADTVTV